MLMNILATMILVGGLLGLGILSALSGSSDSDNDDK